MRMSGAASAVFAAATLCILATSAGAQSFLEEPAAPPSRQNPIAARAAEMAPVLSWLQTQGVKLTYIGDEGGLKAYLGESANGKQQVFYVTPDGLHVVAGLMFKRDGMNVTGIQIGEMQQRFREAQQRYEEATKNVREPSEDMQRQVREGSSVIPSAGTASPSPKVDKPEAVKTEPPKAEAPKVEAPKPEAAKADAKDVSATPVPVIPDAKPASPPAKPSASISPDAKAAPASGASVRFLSGLDQPEFQKAVDDLAWFRVGSEAAPVMYMVADPNCRFCHRAWNDLRPLVMDGKLQLRVIMIAGLPGSDIAARGILSADLPGAEWLTGRGSVDGIQAGPAPEPNSEKWHQTTRILQGNADFIKRFGIQQTPFFGFVGRDGKLYSSTGVPSDLNAFLSQLI